MVRIFCPPIAVIVHNIDVLVKDLLLINFNKFYSLFVFD